MLFLYLLYTVNAGQAQLVANNSSVGQFDAVNYIKDNLLVHKLQVQEPGNSSLYQPHRHIH